MVAVMLFSLLPLTSFAADSSLTYTFTGVNADDAGYAQGTISYTAESAGTYYVYWADSVSALPKYFEIASFTLQQGEKGEYTFPAQVAIPADTDYVIVSTSDSCDNATVSEAIAKFEIPDEKKLYDASTDRQYRYAAFSDIHIDMQNGKSAGFYTNSVAHWEQTLDVCVDREVDFIISAGDQVTNAEGPTLEWLTYQKILAESDYVNPIYESDGNHEPRGSVNKDCDPACGNEEFSLATGLDVDAQSIVDGKDYYEVTEPTTGDHFIFMSEVNAHPGENDNFSQEQLDWLEGLLNKYKGDGKKIFLIQHALLQGYGAGDDTYDPGYQGGIRMAHAETGVQFPNNQRFKAIIEANKEIIWYSGHTHLDFTENQNYSSEHGKSCHMVHIPSVCNTTSYEKDENGIKYLGTSTDYTFYDDTTQGYFVDVFEDATLLYGTNLHYNKVYPQYTYLIEEGEPQVTPTEPVVPRPTKPEPTQPDIENGKVVYCINSANWESVYVHSWIDGGATTTWPGYPMTKTGETVNGFDVYKATVEADYTGVIFNNNDNGSQTVDLQIKENQYFDIKSNAWYETLSDVPQTDALATDRYLVGEFNGWSTTANEFKLNAEGDLTAYLTLSLEANKTYQFKVVREGTWTSCATPITGTVDELQFSKSVSANAKITTKAAGNYVFSFGIASSRLGVKYPEEIEPTEKPTTQEPTQPPQPDIIYGDVDLSGKVDVLDATCIQRDLAKLITLTQEQLVRAKVCGEEKLSIMDATMIQRKLAKIIDKFPVETGKKVDVATTSVVAYNSGELFAKAQDYLSAYFQYASYDTYQALKKTVYKYKDSGTDALTSSECDEITEAIEAFDALRAKVHQQTVYFTDVNGGGNVRAYYFNNATGAEVDKWPGQNASYIQTNSSGQNIYAVTLNFSKFDTIVFSNNGNNKTVDIALDGCSGRLYYPTTIDSTGAYNVANKTFRLMWYSLDKEEEVYDDVAQDITVYFTNKLKWSNVYCYYWLGSLNNTWPGKAMTYVRTTSDGYDIYSMTIPGGSSIIFGDGTKQTVDITGAQGGAGYIPTSAGADGKYLCEKYVYEQ